MKVFYSDDYACAEHAFETTRKARWIAESLRTRPIDGVELVAPPPVTEAQLALAHDAGYIAAVRSGEPRDLAEGQGFAWDAGLWRMVLASNGGAIAAARAALADGVAGSLSSGLHHARRDGGAGYCTFNGLALAARIALREIEAPVLIVDLDAHCGGGTHEILRDEPRAWHLDVAVDRYDSYAPSDRFTLDVVTRADDYLEVVDARLRALEKRPRFGLCIYNAGMDPFEGDPSGLAGVTRAVLQRRDERVFEWCRERALPVAFVLAGGYLRKAHDETSLVELHRITLQAAASIRRPSR